MYKKLLNSGIFLMALFVTSSFATLVNAQSITPTVIDRGSIFGITSENQTTDNVGVTNQPTVTPTTAPASVGSFLTSPLVIVFLLIIIFAIIALLFFKKPKTN